MKKIFLGIITCLIAGQLLAAESDWSTDLPSALTKAKRENKLVLMDFTGSDWCPGCIQLHKDTLSQPAFLDYAKKHLVLVLVDFPAKKPQTKALVDANNDLQKKYEIEGYPTLVMVGPDGKKIWQRVGYKEGGPPALIAQIDSVTSK